MATIVELPHVGESVTEGVIGRWLVQPGQRVERYDPLVEIVTDKVSMEAPSPYAGVFLRALVSEGDTVPMGQPICEMDVDGEPPVASEPPAVAEPPVVAEPSGVEPPVATEGPGAESSVAAEPSGAEPQVVAEPPAPPHGRSFEFISANRSVGPTGSGEGGEGRPDVVQEAALAEAATRAEARAAEPDRSHVVSPLVARIAAEYGLEISAIAGTGAGGRVTKQDVVREAERATAPADPLAPAPAVDSAPAPAAALLPLAPAVDFLPAVDAAQAVEPSAPAVDFLPGVDAAQAVEPSAPAADSPPGVDAAQAVEPSAPAAALPPEVDAAQVAEPSAPAADSLLEVDAAQAVEPPAPAAALPPEPDAAAAVAPPAAAPAIATTSTLPLTAIRRTIAEHMARSTREIPAAWSMVEADVSGLVRARAAHRSEFQRERGVPLTYLPFAVRVVATALQEHSRLNARWDGDHITLNRRVNLGVATATEQGLIVPVLHDAGALGVAGLAVEIDRLVNAARAGALQLGDVQDGTFTLNNTGALGSVISAPIINHPQAAILTTEAIVKRPVVVDGDAIAVRSMMNLCLTFDHRVCDGAEAGAFLRAVKEGLEAIDEGTSLD